MYVNSTLQVNRCMGEQREDDRAERRPRLYIYMYALAAGIPVPVPALPGWFRSPSPSHKSPSRDWSVESVA